MQEIPFVMRIRKAYQTVSTGLFSQCGEDGTWTGELSASALATATAVSALSVFRNIVPQKESKIDTHIERGINYLLQHQNKDGGWGDTDKSVSNIADSVLVKSAFILSGASLKPGNESIIQRASRYIEKEGGIEAVKQYCGKDHTFFVPILANAALAGLVKWESVPQLPFERAALPQSLFRLLNLRAAGYAIPSLIAVGQVRFCFAPQCNPFINFLRKMSVKRTLRLLEKMQPESGGYLEAVPLTAFTVMSLIAAGHSDSRAVRSGIWFLNNSVREDGSWAVYTNLATWTTTLSVNALGKENISSSHAHELTNYLLSSQHKNRHPITGAESGGWGWTNLSGAVPDADDTAGVLLALMELYPSIKNEKKRAEVIESLLAGIQWLLKLQNTDGGIPAFCRGRGVLPFDRSSPDITAHCLRAFSAVFRSEAFQSADTNCLSNHTALNSSLKQKMSASMEAMYIFLRKMQQSSGAWHPLRFGNQYLPGKVNPFYGTAKVISALCSYQSESRIVTEEKDNILCRGVDYLFSTQNFDGGWGAAPAGIHGKTEFVSTIEETALAAEALACFQKYKRHIGLEKITAEKITAEKTTLFHKGGIEFLVKRIEQNDWQEPSPIGLYFAKLWYYEKLYPHIFTAAALRTSVLVQNL